MSPEKWQQIKGQIQDTFKDAKITGDIIKLILIYYNTFAWGYANSQPQ